MFREQIQDRGDADAIAILSPRHAPDRFAPVAQLVGLVIGIERQRERAARAALPARRTKAAASTDLVDEAAPVRLRPLPGFELGHVVHDLPPDFVYLVLASRQRAAGDRQRLPSDPR